MTVARLAPGQHLSVGNIKPCGARLHQIAQARSLGPGQLDLLLARPAHAAPPVAGASMPDSARYFWDATLAPADTGR
jgi:hypothetical protein